MNILSKSTRELYVSIRSEIIGIHYRFVILKKFYTTQDIVISLNNTAPMFFAMIRNDLLDYLTVSINRLLDPPSIGKFRNASLKQLINCLDRSKYSQLVIDLKALFDQTKADSSRIEYWRKKWSGHRDFDVLTGAEPIPKISLPELDIVISDLYKFKNKFEGAFYDPNEHRQMDPNKTDTQNAEDFEEFDRLRIREPKEDENMNFLDDGSSLLRIIRESQENP